MLQSISQPRRAELTRARISSLAQAILGGTVTIPGIDGDVLLHVKAGTQPGRRSRLPGRGIPRVNDSTRGDHYVHFEVKIPTYVG